jgi:capsular polysaccharide biosynthesis protein
VPFGADRQASDLPVSMAMDKIPNTNPMVTVAQTIGGDPKGQRPPGIPQAPPPGGGLPNPVVIIRRAMAHWPVAAVVMVLGVLATVQVIRMRKPLYQSETVIFYRQGALSEGTSTNDTLRTLGAKLKETLLAQSNLKKIIDEHHLFADIVDKRGYSDAVDQFRKQIDWKSRSNDTFVITFKGSTREEAQEVTTRLADMLVEENAKSRQDRAKGRTEFLDAEKKRVDEDLDRFEKDRAQFIAEHPEFATDSGNQVGAAVRDAQKKVDAALAGERQARLNGGRFVPGVGPRIPGVGGLSAAPVDPLLLSARTQAMSELVAAKRDLADKSLRFTEQHPDVHAASQRVAAAEAALKKTEDAIVAAQPPPPPAPPAGGDPYAGSSAKPVAKGPPGGGAAAVDPKKKPTAKAPEAVLVALETEWSRLNREVGKLRTQQGQLETKLFQAEMEASSELGGYAATIAILDPAFKPAGPSGTPNRTIIVGGFLASLIAGIVLAAARGIFLDDRLFDASEVEGLGLVPVLGVVPKQKVEKTKTRGIRA